MHVAQCGFLLDSQQRTPQQLLTDWYTLVDTAEAAGSANVRVSVVQAAQLTTTIQRNTIDYHFLPAASQPCSAGGAADMLRLMQRLQPDVIHVHGLGFPLHVGALCALVPGIPVLLQDHADRVPRLWRRRAWRHGHQAVAGVAFCAAAQAQPFEQARLLGAGVTVFEIPESTSRFTPGDQVAARSVTGLYGTPAILWVGHLNANKDPLTVLRGFSLILDQIPEAHLWMCFGNAPLLPIIKNLLAAQPSLAARVHLLGAVPHVHVQDLMRSADLFVLGSRREGSGYALIEALATGLTPVVSDIPSFRSLTNHGAVGALWPCDDATAFGQSLLRTAGMPNQQRRIAALSHFRAQLSSTALGARLATAYHQLIAGHAPESRS
jgi:glycosyltransferase involved in cell wall biosynthesis